jgi:hypothetical protein
MLNRGQFVVTSEKKKGILLGVIAVLIMAVSAVALYKVKPILFPDVAIVAPVDPACDLHSAPCTTRLADGQSVSLSITPKHIPLVKPLKFHVEIAGLQSENVDINFVGVDMNMGFNRFKLQRDGTNSYIGDGMLPVCVRDSMLWEAQVLIQSEKGLISVPYRFATVRPGLTSRD